MAKVSLRAYNREIESMIDSGHLDEAIAHSKHILKSFPKYLETYRLLGKAYLESKRYPDAVDVFSRALVVAPNDFVSHVGMSIIRDDENKLDDAIWHMERAFETQPSNAAIQSELQRLYGRRDGVQLPRIRMTRGALAQMYVQGELYPQAISEIKSVLQEDPGRNDMQVLLARAYYRSGLKNDAAEVASSVLRSNPYCLDANRVLVDILGADHPESVQAYRQRVIELDPYASQVTGSMFSSNEVPDLAVSLERLDWNGQPVGAQSDWEMTQAVSLESGQRSDEQPDWLKGSASEMPFDQTQGGSISAFDMPTPPEKPAEPAEDLPDFLRAAGWGQSTGSFDESKPVFADAERESDASAQPIEQGDLPDWVKAMAPQQSVPTPPVEEESEEEMPDWINKIGSSALPLPSESNDQPDWMTQMESPAAQPADDQPDWLKQPDSPQQPAASDDQPDWLKGFESETESIPSPAPTGDLDWLSQLSGESKPLESAADEFDFLNRPEGGSEPAASSSNEFDFLNQPPSEPESVSASSNEFDFLKDPGSQPETTPAASSTDDFDFLNEMAAETEQLAPASTSAPEPSMNVKDNLGMSEEERDDSFAWLENLAAKQGATEGLLTKPEERLEEEPEWVKQAKGIDTNVSEPPAEQPPVAQPAGNLEELGKSEQEQDDSFAWLENLAAKQGATEGLLTKPEERLEQEPEWIRQAKSLKDQAQPPAQVPPEETQEIPVAEPEPSASLEELGKSEQEQDDSFAWLENLAAKQGATEGLLTTPEERLEEEPDWVKQAKDMSAEQLSTADQAPSADDTAVWLQSLGEETASASEPESSGDDTAIWFKKLEAAEETPSQPVESSPTEDLPAWMQNLEEEQATETQFNIPISDIASSTAAKEAADLPEASEWMSSIEQESVTEPAASTEEKASELPAEEIPSWLSELDREEEQAVTPTAMDADLPAWLRDETGELMAEPTKIEPTRAADWQPVEKGSEPEPVMQQPEVQPPQPEPEPVMVQPEFQPAQPEVPEVVNIIEERIAAVQEAAPAVEPPRKAARLKGTGKLSMPMDPVLGQARSELAGSNLNGALENYSRLIKKGRFLDEVIYDLRDASYRFPVDVNIWQSLGDAYMRANRLQDALDAYTKAEELLR